MAYSREYSIFYNTYAILGQPVHLLIILITTATIIALLLVSLHNISIDLQVHQVEHQIDVIITEVTSMYEYANEGSLRIVHVDFPNSLRFIIFGSLPLNGSQQPTNLTLDENIANNYYFVMNDGTVRVFHSSARFSQKNLREVAIFYAGAYEITLELSERNGRIYVALY